MKFRQRGQQLLAQVDALSLRERGMLMIGAFMVLFLLWDWMLMDDISRRGKAVNAEIETTRAGIERLNRAVAAAAQSRGGDPNAALQAQIATSREQLAVLDAELAARAGQVIPPEQMAGVLQDMLRRQGRLKLIRVASLPPEALFARTADNGEELPGAVYRHGLEFEVEGRYLDILAYLREMEALESQFFWEALELESDRYPLNRVSIRVYSLNLEEGWLGV